MAKEVANEVKVSTMSTSDHALLSPSSQYQSPKQLAVIGKGMCRNNLLLSQVLQADIQRWYPWSGLQQSVVNRKKKPQPEAFIGWGHKKSFQRADKAATRQDVNTLSIEDGFLRSLDSGISSRHGLSVVVDDIGIYFDMAHHSRLEQLIVERTKSTSNDRAAGEARARHLMARICEEKLSKYNSIIDCPSLDKLINEENINEKESASQFHVLLIDQVAGDASVKGAGANKRQFKKMLKFACHNHPNAHIWIKAHPASKSGYLSNLKLPKNVRLLTEFLNPIELLKQVSEVYTVSSHMGFEALMLGKKVYCFGVSWYSGWGLTDDTNSPRNLLKSVQKRRLASAKIILNNRDTSNLAVFPATSHKTLETSLETLFYSAYIDYSRYVDPVTKQACDIDTAIEWLVTNRWWQARLEGDLTISEFSRWTLPFVKAFIDLPRTTLFFKPNPRL